MLNVLAQHTSLVYTRSREIACKTRSDLLDDLLSTQPFSLHFGRYHHIHSRKHTGIFSTRSQDRPRSMRRVVDDFVSGRISARAYLSRTAARDNHIRWSLVPCEIVHDGPTSSTDAACSPVLFVPCTDSYVRCSPCAMPADTIPRTALHVPRACPRRPPHGMRSPSRRLLRMRRTMRSPGRDACASVHACDRASATPATRVSQRGRYRHNLRPRAQAHTPSYHATDVYKALHTSHPSLKASYLPGTHPRLRSPLRLYTLDGLRKKQRLVGFKTGQESEPHTCDAPTSSQRRGQRRRCRYCVSGGLTRGMVSEGGALCRDSRSAEPAHAASHLARQRQRRRRRSPRPRHTIRRCVSHRDVSTWQSRCARLTRGSSMH